MPERPVLVHSRAGVGEATIHPHSYEEMVSTMEALARKYEPICGIPYSVDVVGPTGRLSVGLGSEQWMLTASLNDGTVMNSLGDESAEGETSFYFGDHTLLSRKYLVPRELALKAVREWWEHGSLSPCILWTDRIY
jgi:Immunity protein Imm1